MVREAQMNDRAGCNGHDGESPQRAVARSFRELLGDIMTLGELQVQLFQVDLAQCKARAVIPTVALAAGVTLLLSCIPVALVCVALFIDELTRLTPAQSFLATVAGGLVLGGLLALAGAWFLRRSLAVMNRSQNELGQNYRWVKKMLTRLSTGPFTRRPAERAMADEHVM